MNEVEFFALPFLPEINFRYFFWNVKYSNTKWYLFVISYPKLSKLIIQRFFKNKILLNNNWLLLITINQLWLKSKKLQLQSNKKARRKPLNNKVNNKLKLVKPSVHKTYPVTSLLSATFLPLGMTLLSTLLISPVEKLSPESQVVWKSSPTETNHHPTLLWWLLLMSSTDSNNWVSPQFTLSLEPEVEQEIKPQDQVLNLPSEQSPEMESRSEESKT